MIEGLQRDKERQRSGLHTLREKNKRLSEGKRETEITLTHFERSQRRQGSETWRQQEIARQKDWRHSER